MQIKHYKNKNSNTNDKSALYEFTSLQELVEYIHNTPSCALWGVSSLKDNEHKDFTKTKSLEEALELLKNGWTEGAQKINTKLKEEVPDTATKIRQQSVYDIAGGNASVARYLQGVPTNMIRQVRTPVKQKTVNLYANIGFTADVTTKEIIDSCIKTLQEAVNYENAGARVNIYVINVISLTSGNGYIAVKIPVKRSTERLNILKLAFPMAHPSMLRRLMFAFRERCEVFKDELNYGSSVRGQNAIDFIENCK